MKCGSESAIHCMARSSDQCMEHLLTDTPSCSYRLPITNADRIRCMSDESLAKFIDNIAESVMKGVYCSKIGKEGNEKQGCFDENENEDCISCAFDRLQQPAEQTS